MNAGFRKKGWKWIVVGVSIPLLLVVVLVISLYLPPVQNFLRKQVVVRASEAMGMDVQVGRIDLHFPLDLRVGEVSAVRASDTLLHVGSLRVRVQLLPLFRGRVEVDHVILEEATVHTADYVPGICVDGTIGRFLLKSHGVDLKQETAVLNNIELADTRVNVVLMDTTASEETADSTGLPLRWKLKVERLRVDRLQAGLTLPGDSIALSVNLPGLELAEAEADLGEGAYALRKAGLEGATVRYDVGNLLGDEWTSGRGIRDEDSLVVSFTRALSTKWECRDIRLDVDSLLFHGHRVKAVIRDFSLNERSGLCLSSLEGHVYSDSVGIHLPRLQLRTPHSELSLQAEASWEGVEQPERGHFGFNLDGRVGKPDLLWLAAGTPESFARDYPSHPLSLNLGVEGNLSRLRLSALRAELPGAFRLDGRGEAIAVADSVARHMELEAKVQTGRLDFLRDLAALPADTVFRLPDSLYLATYLTLEGSRVSADLTLREGAGQVSVDASYDWQTEVYRAELAVDTLDLHHFLPGSGLQKLTLHTFAEGQGMDFTSRRSTGEARLRLDSLGYDAWKLTGVEARLGLQDGCATLGLTSDNTLLKMRTDVSLRTDRPTLDGKLRLDVASVGLDEWGLLEEPLPRPLTLQAEAEARGDTLRLELTSGDLRVLVNTGEPWPELAARGQEWASLLTKQLEARQLDMAALRRSLPMADLSVKAGRDNPLGDWLDTQQMGFDDLTLDFGCSPGEGIHGGASLIGLHTDSLRLDTLFLTAGQDTTRLRLQAGLYNSRQNPDLACRTTLTGEVWDEEAALTWDFEDGEGTKGVLFGIRLRPLTEGNGRGNGILLSLTPEHPIIAYREFDFTDGARHIYLHNDMHVYAHVDMCSDDGIGFRMLSDRTDTTSLQNIRLSLTRFRLSELGKVMPYLPRLTGLLSAEAHYIQTDTTALQLTAEVDVKKLTYEKRPVGDVGAKVSWLPQGMDRHELDAMLTLDSLTVLAVDGLLGQEAGGMVQMDIQAAITRLPLRVANAFVPDGMIALGGKADGSFHLSGTTEAPLLNGDLSLDSMSVDVRQLGARYWLDNRPIRVKDNRLLLDSFAIYTTSPNPFTIDGNIDFRDLERPRADLRLRARDYTLLDAPRTRQSLVYGKVKVDLSATASGPLDALMLRGDMHLLGSTDVTYVLTDSPLTVEDRLDGLVSFVSFADTVSVAEKQEKVLPPGGIDMLMGVHIDEAVRLRADLSTDRSKYIELEGGGDLALQYTPQGDMNLTGRYTLSGGVMKYSLPVIPLKAFQIASGSYVDWRGDVMNPAISLKATERVRASVADEDGESSRMVNFDVSIAINGKLEALELVFDIAAPEDVSVQNELQAMGTDERSKQAIAMLATGIYLKSGVKGGGLNMGTALNSVLQSQINSLAGSVKGASISVGVEDRTSAETGDKQTDYSFRYAQRFFNDRVQIVIGGKVSTGANATNDMESFIDNISLEYRLDASGTRYIRAFYNKNYESVLDGEITETGVGLVLRRKMDRLSELFIFKRRKEDD